MIVRTGACSVQKLLGLSHRITFRVWHSQLPDLHLPLVDPRAMILDWAFFESRLSLILVFPPDISPLRPLDLSKCLALHLTQLTLLPALLIIASWGRPSLVASTWVILRLIFLFLTQILSHYYQCRRLLSLLRVLLSFVLKLPHQEHLSPFEAYRFLLIWMHLATRGQLHIARRLFAHCLYTRRLVCLFRYHTKRWDI